MGSLSLVEFHDAVVEHLIFLPPTNLVEVQFSHVSCYMPEGKDTFGVWSYAARLSCLNVSLLTVTYSSSGGSITDGSVVDDLEFFDSSGQLIHLAEGIALVDVRLRMAFCLSSSVLECAASSVDFRLGERGERIETWSGPLIGP